MCTQQHATFISRLWCQAYLGPLQGIGNKIVPELPATDRDTYIRQVSGTVGLSALAATVVRVAPALLLSLCSAEGNKPEPILGELGQLERHILWQLALAENWKRGQDAAKEAAKGIVRSNYLLSWHTCVCSRNWLASAQVVWLLQGECLACCGLL